MSCIENAFQSQLRPYKDFQPVENSRYVAVIAGPVQCLCWLQNKEHFQRNRVATFVDRPPAPLGELVAARVWEEGQGWGAAWHLHTLEVTHLPSGRAWTFKCDQWVPKVRGNRTDGVRGRRRRAGRRAPRFKRFFLKRAPNSSARPRRGKGPVQCSFASARGPETAPGVKMRPVSAWLLGR